MDSDLMKALVALGGLLAFGFIVILLAMPAPAVRADEYHTGTGKGYYGEITVEVGLTAGAIVSVRVTDHEDTPGLADNAIDAVVAKIIEAQSADVDTISGATATSRGVIEAAKMALAAAGR